MPLTFFWEALGGLGLFILGMKFMSEGLQRIAGERVRRWLESITGNRLSAALMGSCLSSLLQSSSAASIIVIGFVNAGLVSLYQALGVLLGTGIGATVAIQFLAFKVSFYSLPIIFLGVLLKFFCKKRRLVYVGDLLLGAGLVFLGLQTMESGLVPLSRSTIFQGLHNHFFSWKVSSVLLGAALTFLMQSSSAAMGVIIAMAGSGLVSFGSGAAMVMGDVLGTSLITVIASINGTLAARRTAFIFFMMNLSAVVIVLLLFPFFLELIFYVSPGDADAVTSGAMADPLRPEFRPYIARHLANAHTAFNIVCLALFLPLLGFFARSAKKLFPEREAGMDMEPRAKYIDRRVLNTPPIALLQARSEIRRMADIAGSMYEDVAQQFQKYDAKRATRVRQKEEVLDILQRDVSDFLVLLSRQPLSASVSMQVPIMLHDVANLEHIGDQNVTISRCLMHKKEERILFSGPAMSELRNLSTRVGEMVHLAATALVTSHRHPPGDVARLKKSIREMHELMKSNHLKRLTAGRCTVLAGVLFSDIANAFMKIAEYAENIVQTEREFNNEPVSGSD